MTEKLRQTLTGILAGLFLAGCASSSNYNLERPVETKSERYTIRQENEGKKPAVSTSGLVEKSFESNLYMLNSVDAQILRTTEFYSGGSFSHESSAGKVENRGYGTIQSGFAGTLDSKKELKKRKEEFVEDVFGKLLRTKYSIVNTPNWKAKVQWHIPNVGRIAEAKAGKSPLKLFSAEWKYKNFGVRTKITSESFNRKTRGNFPIRFGWTHRY